MKYCSKLLILTFSLISTVDSKKDNLIRLTEDNWKQILDGEWMVDFVAPWCPACADLKKSWKSFSEWSQDGQDLAINIAEVDVTLNPGLSGRFLITTLPTIYHVKNGVFRLYTGSRDKEDLVKFVEQRKWTVIDPMSKWQHPDTFQMTIVAGFFRVSLAARDLHYHLIEKVGVPAWASYTMFGLATLVLGCLLGFLMVLFVDWLLPKAVKMTKAAPKPQEKEQSNQSQDTETETTDSSSEKTRKRHGSNKKGEEERQQNGKANKDAPEEKKKQK